MAMRGPRLQVGSAAWVAEERSCALQIAQSEVEEFSFSARNEFDWLNEHMAGIFDENETNIAETFKTPGKLRGKTPRTARKAPPGSESRLPLSDVFSATPNGSTNRFAQKLNRINSPKPQEQPAKSSPRLLKGAAGKHNAHPPKPTAAPGGMSQDSGYYGSQDIYSQKMDVDDEFVASQPQKQANASHNVAATSGHKYAESPYRMSPSPAKEKADFDEVHDAGVDSSSPPQKGAIPATTSLETVSLGDGSPAPSAGDEPDDAQSNSDGSSPIRPLVRKSSLNFASLPAREPLTAGKSIGARASRTSYFDSNRQSQYSRPTREKSYERDADDQDDEDDAKNRHTEVNTTKDSKTYTQRLQDQISMLGKSQPTGSRPSKSTHHLASLQQQQTAAASKTPEPPQSPAFRPIEKTKSTPGAYPDDDDWIDPPAPAQTENRKSPRPSFPKSHSADVMEGISKSEHVGAADFDPPAEGRDGQSVSPQRKPFGHEAPTTPGHTKSVSVPSFSAVPQPIEDQTLPLTKAATTNTAEMDAPQTPSHSPSRVFRDSPLKQVKNKLSSILKSSRGLLASSAVASAEGKTYVMSPSMAHLASYAAPSSESVVSRTLTEAQSAEENKTMPIARRTRASAEREKEEKRREKETKVQEQQMDKLEKAREKEREKARVFSKEQERIAAMERQMASKKEDERPLVKETPKPTRSSPRKAPRAPETATKTTDLDVDMADAPVLAPPSSVPRPANPSQSTRSKDVKRPVKPTRETQTRVKQAPTVIRVNTGSQHSQYQSMASASSTPANESTAMATAQPQQPAPSQPAPSKASKATLQSKPSTQNLKGAASGVRTKVPDSAVKKREQEEREAQRRREAKAEMERKRAASQEEQRKQEQRRQETERQKQRDREQAAAHAEAKQNAQRQAMIEKAKQTKAPPPATRAQPNGPPDFSSVSREAQPPRPASRLDTGASGSMYASTSKAGVKRALPDATDDAKGKRPQSRGGPSYQAKDAKRRRTSEDRDLDAGEPPSIKGPPVRPSAGFMKEPPKKSLYQGGYTNAPSNVSRDLFKATVTSQHGGQNKSTHPLDMAQISKGAIPFAPSATPQATMHKTPARPPVVNGSKSTAKAHQKSSPRFPNGDSIELPEINTDDEDDEDDGYQGMVPEWAQSPNLRLALLRQETMDPIDIFGPPKPLDLEEVFSKSKERWHKFRARTSSGNWSGADRLTEEEIMKDKAAREKLQRDGAWSYELNEQLL